MRTLLRAVASASVLVMVAAASAQAAPARPRPGDPGELPLGPAGLVETRTTSTVAPGVTLTRIVRGEAGATMVWTIELAIPSAEGSPDPDAPPAALKDRASAEQLVADLVADGFEARAEEVVTDATADFAGGPLGWRVRVGSFDSAQAAAGTVAALRAAGYSGSSLYTGWDGEAGATGPWRVDVLTIDPRRFRGSVEASFGPDLEGRERTSDLAAAVDALAGVNAGFYVFDRRAGAPGDPAGIGVYDGVLLSEPVSGRPALVLGNHGRAEVARLTWEGSVVGRRGERLALDGINRVPGLIRNCGGTADDVPTALPVHDFTCTDPDEVVAFTPEFAATTPAGAGTEVVLDERGRVVEVRSPRGGTLPTGGSSIQATGDLADDLTAMARPGSRLRITSALRTAEGRRFGLGHTAAVVNGGPELVRDGDVHVTPATDGMVQAGNPSFYYGWVHKRHPRTFAGVDGAGRLVLVTAEGRDTDGLGLSIVEAAEVAEALGLRDAVNLDGGGSTAMVVGGELLTDPSDATGERAVGDAILVLPR